MAVRGTPTRTGTQIVEQADAMGGSIEATGDVYASEIPATARARQREQMLNLATAIALHPTIPNAAGQAPRAPPPAPAPWRETRVVPGAQAQILMGSLAPALTDPDYPAVKVLSTVLGGGMAGRFFSDLRDKQGLAYTTGTQYPARVDTSFFLAQLGTAPENVAKAEAALREQLERVQRERVGDEELRGAKAYVLGNLAMARRTPPRQPRYPPPHQ